MSLHELLQGAPRPTRSLGQPGVCPPGALPTLLEGASLQKKSNVQRRGSESMKSDFPLKNEENFDFLDFELK